VPGLAWPASSYHVCATPRIFIAKSRLRIFVGQLLKIPCPFARFLLCALSIRILTVDGLSSMPWTASGILVDQNLQL